MMPLPLAKFAFVLHAIVETPAAASFLLAPQRQLSPAFLVSPQAAEVLLILNNLGGLLLATVCLSLVMAVSGHTMDAAVRGLLALSLGIYHVFPCHRAYQRLKQAIGMDGPQAQTFGGPPVHLAVHLVCFVFLVGAGFLELIVYE